MLTAESSRTMYEPLQHRSGVIRDCERIRILRVNRIRLLDYFHDISGAGSNFQRQAKIRELLWRADRIRLHAAIVQIPDIAADSQALCAVFRKVAEAHALHESRHQKSLRLFCVRHKPKN